MGTGKSDQLNEFHRLLIETIKGKIKPQLVWAIVTEVDWEEKTMTAEGLIDELAFFDVSLGLGSVYKKPKVGSKCLLGVLENKAAATFLIEAEAIEEMQIVSDTANFIIKEDGFIIRKDKESLKDVLNDFIDEVNKIVVIQGRTINTSEVVKIKERLNTILK